MGRKSREAKVQRRQEQETRRHTEGLRRKSAMLPFLLIFGAGWFLFGTACVVQGYLIRDNSWLLAGGTVALIGAGLLVRAALIRRSILVELGPGAGKKTS